MSVDITLNARDGVSGVLDNITQSTQDLVNALDNVSGAAGGAGNNIKNALSGISANASKIGSTLEGVGNTLTKKVTKPVVATATALAGLTIAKGFSRMQQIDSAKAKLMALGNSASDVSAIMDNALAAVKGTAYGMDEAATAAASAVAAGIKPGKDLQKYLSTVGDAAAIAGVDMASMGDIFNKVAAKGKAYNGSLSELATRGVPIYQWLADEMKMSTEEVFKAAQKGEVDLATFRAAIEKNVGGAAAAIGSSTISGAISNIGAAISRIGANFLGSADDANSFAGKILPLLNSVMAALGLAEDKAKSLGGAFAKAIGPTMDSMTNFFNGIADGSKKIDTAKVKMGALAGIAATALGPALVLVGKGFSLWGAYGGKIKTIGAAIAKIAPNLTRLAGPVGIAIGLFTMMWAKSEAFRTSVTGLFSEMWTSVQTVFTALQPILSTLFDTLGTTLAAIGDAIAPLITAITPIISVMAKVASAVIGALTPIITVISKIVTWLASKIGPAAQTAATIMKTAFAGVAGIMNGVASAINAVKSAWNAIKSGVKTLAVKFTQSGNVTSGPKSTKNTGGGKQHATGTRSAEGGVALVGERGPELVDLPKGARVHTAQETKGMLGSNVVVNMTNNVSQQGLTVDQLISQLSQKLSEAMSATAEGVM